MTNASVVSWIFAGLSLLYLASITTYLIVRRRSDELPAAANRMLGFLCAVAAGFCAFFFSGTLGLSFEVPGTEINGNAAGGFGVFVLVLLVWLRAAPDRIVVTVQADPTLRAMSQVLSDLEHVWKGVVQIEQGKRPTESVTHRLVGTGSATKLVFTETGSIKPLQTISLDEVKTLLTEPERQLLLDTEASMARKVAAWRRAYAEVGDPADANLEQKKRLLRIASSMSNDLDAIFSSIERTLGGELQDHYSAERWIASRASGLLNQLEMEAAGPLEREFGD